MEALDIYARGKTIVTPEEHHALLHPNQVGTVISRDAHAQPQWYKHHPGNSESNSSIARHTNGLDRFITVNEFRGWKTTELLTRLCACFVDIEGIDDVGVVLDALTETKMPAPSMVVRSGRGMHPYWLLCPTTRQAHPVWKLVQNNLNDALVSVLGKSQKDNRIGVDTGVQNAAQILRLCGSINGASNTVVRGEIITGDRWSMHELADEVLGHRAPGHTRHSGTSRKATNRSSLAARRALNEKPSNRTHTRSKSSRWSVVFKDLIAIAKAQNECLVPEHYRDYWLHLTANALCWFVELDTLPDEIARLAATYTDLTEQEATAYVQPVINRAIRAYKGEKDIWDGKEVDPRYNYSNARMLSLLEAIIPPGLGSDLRALITKDERKLRRARGEKMRRARNGAITRPDTDFGIKACELKAAGTPGSIIAQILGISEAMVSRLVRQGTT